MLKMARTNRLLIEKAIALKYTRGLANKILLANKAIKNKLSRGLTQKFNEEEYSILQKAVRDLISINWIYSLAGIKLLIPLRRAANKYFENGKEESWKNNNVAA